MKHYGDITKLNGAELPLVDIITGGSPCQDLSVAGKRAGLAGERSGLFMEQIRIIKEMRDESKRQLESSGADVDLRLLRPRYMVWENVPGAFSSNGGKDFHAVLEETAKVAERDACVPGFEAWGGRWPSAGCIMGDGWSIAWRVHDAQFWGVPQRRKRIALVADFGGETAPEILFEREGLSGDIAPGGKEGEGVATDAEGCVGKASVISLTTEMTPKVDDNGICFSLRGRDYKDPQVVCLNDQGGQQMDVSDGVSGTLRAQEHGHQPIVYGICGFESNSMKSGNPNSGIYEAETARTLDLNGGSPACNQGGMAIVHGADMYNGSLTGDIAATLNATSCDSPTHSGPSVVCLEGNGSRPSHRGDGYSESEIMYTLNSTEHHAVAVENHPADSRVKVSEDGIVQTLSSRMGTGGGNVPMVMEPVCINNGQAHIASHLTGGVSQTLNCMHDPMAIMAYGLDRAAYNQGENALYKFAVDEEKIGTQVAKGPGAFCCGMFPVVRRLTPMECERLQAYPDHWTDIGDWVDSKGKKHKGDSDSPRYKALGNSIALPFWRWLAERMVSYLGPDSRMASLFDGIGGFPLVYSECGCTPVWASEIEEFPIAVTKIRFQEDEDGRKNC